MNKSIKIKAGDKVVFSSDPIPGNENEVYGVIEQLSLLGADVVYSDIKDQLHASGHGNQEDLKLLIRFTNPKYFIPIGGTIRHQTQYTRLVETMGYDKKSVYALDEGDTVWFEKGKTYKGDSVDTKNVYVDAYGVGDVGTMVLRDRKTLSSEGIVLCVLPMNAHGMLTSRPKILSKGFVFEKGEEELFETAIKFIEKILKPRSGETMLDLVGIKKHLTQNLEDFFYKERGREPLVMVEIIQM